MPDEELTVNQAATASLARRMAAEYIETCQFGLRRYGHECTEPDTEFIETKPAAEIGWRELSAVGADDPERSAALWRKICQAATDERAGHYRAAVTVGADKTPMNLARFYVLRRQLADQWAPRNGIEENLLDQLAQAEWMREYWTRTQVQRITEDSERDRREFDELREKEVNYRYGTWTPPRQTDAEAQERAAIEIDRWHRIYVRTLRALGNMRRYNVVINNAGQVNVAEKQIVTK